MKHRVIDVVCNLLTPDIIAGRPLWTRSFHSAMNKSNRVGGVDLDEHVAMMDEAGVDLAFLIAPKMGRRGLPGSWEMDVRHIIEATEKYPDRFRGLAGINPFDGVAGLKELQLLVENYGFVGAHAYPHWFGLAIDHRRWYPYIAKCGELGIPLQTQVGRCLRYTDEQPLPDVGFPHTLDTIACDFPEVDIVGIHTGWPWVEEMISVADKHPNVYISIDAYAPRYLPASLVHYMKSWGAGKVMFGTDWPIIEMKRAIVEIGDMDLSPEAERSLFSGVAEKVYEL